MEIAVRYRTDAYRTVYVSEILGALWVVHAFLKKSKSGIKTPKADISLIRDRIAWLRRNMEQ